MTEHYVTLLDSSFLPYLLVLHGSMLDHAGDFHLWVVAMDDALAGQLEALELAQVTCIPVGELEAAEPRLLQAKAGRGRGEYCWTVTPFTFAAVRRRCPEAPRVTYLDVDLCFFSDPAPLFGDLERSGKHVLITEHSFDDRLRHLEARSGRFCVQFLTEDGHPAAREVLSWWEERCLEWCYNRYEEGRFGDQKYLDQWPLLFDPAVHVLSLPQLTQAPWNRDKFSGVVPVFYHFQGFRPLRGGRVILFYGTAIQRRNRDIYEDYLVRFARSLALVRRHRFPVRQPDYGFLKLAKARLWLAPLGMAAFGRLEA